MNNNLFARELKQRFPDQIIVAQAGPYQDVMIVCYDYLYFSDAFRDLLTARSARLVNWTRDLQPLGHDTDHCMQMTIAPKHREYWAQDRRRQISLKLSSESDAVLLEYLDHVDNVQGLIKSLLMDHIAAKEAVHAGASMIEGLPSAQPKVIRCKDCKFYFKGENFPCGISSDILVEDDDFCSFAERIDHAGSEV